MAESLSWEHIRAMKTRMLEQARRPPQPLVFVMELWMAGGTAWPATRDFLENNLRGVRRYWWDGVLYRNEDGAAGRLAPPGWN
jgi:hypothetical protein